MKIGDRVKVKDQDIFGKIYMIMEQKKSLN